MSKESQTPALPSAPIRCGAVCVYLNDDLGKAANHMRVCAGSLVRGSDCDNATLWKLEEAYQVLANIIDRLNPEDPAVTAAERNQHGK